MGWLSCFGGSEAVLEHGSKRKTSAAHGLRSQGGKDDTANSNEVTVPAQEESSKSWAQSFSKLSSLQMEAVQETLRKVGGLIGTMAEERAEDLAPLESLKALLKVIARDCDAVYASVSLLSSDGIYFQTLGSVGESCTDAILGNQRVWAVAGNSSGGRGSTGGSGSSNPYRPSRTNASGSVAQSGRGSSMLELKAATAAGAAYYCWSSGGTLLPPFDWRQLHATGMQLIFCAPIRNGEKVLGALNLGYEQQTDLARHGETFAAFLSLVTSNLVPVLAEPALQAYLEMAKATQSSTSVDSMVQQALNQVRAALSQRSNPNVWFRGAMFSTDTAAATLFDDMAQPGILSQAPKRAHKRERSGNAKALQEILAAGGMLRTHIPLRGTLVHIMRSHKKQVMVPDVQKLVNQMGNIHTDVFSCKYIKPPTSVLLVPLKNDKGLIYGALYCMSDIGTDFEVLDPSLVREVCMLMGHMLYKQMMNDVALHAEFMAIRSVTEEQVLTSEHSGTLQRHNTNGSLRPSPGVSPGVSPQHSFTNMKVPGVAMGAGQPYSPTAERMKGLAREFDNSSCAGSAASAASGGSFVVQQSASSTTALVTGLTEKLNHKRVMASMAGTDPNALHDLQLLVQIGEGGFARVFKGLWRGLSVAVKVVIVQPGNGKAVMKNAHEISLLQTLTHPQIITAYCCLTDIPVRDVINTCIRATSTKSRNNLAAAISGPTSATQTPNRSSHQGSGLSMAGGAGLGAAVRDDAMCHVEVLELCDLGSLAQASRASIFAMPGSTKPQEPVPAASADAASPENQPSAAAAAAPLSVDMQALLRTLLEIAGAMSYLHRLGVVHCDLKPGNILLKSSSADPRGFTTKLSDFGLSRVEDDDENNATFPFNSCGTAAYVAPEALVCQKKVNTSVDVYAFGIIMWELYTGQRPYGTMKQQMIAEEVVLRGLRPRFHSHTPAAYSSLAQSCWAATSGARPTFDMVMWGLHSMLEQITGGGFSIPMIVRDSSTHNSLSTNHNNSSSSPNNPSSYNTSSAHNTSSSHNTSSAHNSHAHSSSHNSHAHSSSHNSHANNHGTSADNNSYSHGSSVSAAYSSNSYASGSSSSPSYGREGPFAAVAGPHLAAPAPAAAWLGATAPAAAVAAAVASPGAASGILSGSSSHYSDWKSKLTVQLPTAADGETHSAAPAPAGTAAAAGGAAGAASATAGAAESAQPEHAMPAIVPIIRSNSSPHKGPRRTVSFSQVLDMCYLDENGRLIGCTDDDNGCSNGGRSGGGGSSGGRSGPTSPRRSGNGSKHNGTIVRAHSQGEREMNAAQELLLARERPSFSRIRTPSLSGGGSGGGSKDGASPASRLGPVRLSSVGSAAGVAQGAGGGLISPGTPAGGSGAMTAKAWAGEPVSPDHGA